MQRNGIINVDTAQCIINTEGGGGYYDTTAVCWNLDVGHVRSTTTRKKSQSLDIILGAQYIR